MKWKNPPIIKVYEALGAVADERIELVGGSEAKVASSNGKKNYQVSFSAKKNAIMSNDNGSYWQGYLAYPSIALLLKLGVLKYEAESAELLKGVAWKTVNKKHKNDFDKSLEEILSGVDAKKRGELINYAEILYERIKTLDLSLLGKRTQPPKED